MWNNELCKEHYDRMRRDGRSLIHLHHCVCVCVPVPQRRMNVRTTLWEGLTTRGDLYYYILYTSLYVYLHILYISTVYFLCRLPLIVFLCQSSDSSTRALFLHKQQKRSSSSNRNERKKEYMRKITKTKRKNTKREKNAIIYVIIHLYCSKNCYFSFFVFWFPRRRRHRVFISLRIFVFVFLFFSTKYTYSAWK